MISEGVRALFFMAGVAAGVAIGYTIGTVQVDRKEEGDGERQGGSRSQDE